MGGAILEVVKAEGQASWLRGQCVYVLAHTCMCMCACVCTHVHMCVCVCG